MMNFIKGPVCRGQMAVDVIHDRFWVYFVDPAARGEEAAVESLLLQSDKLRLPSEDGSNVALIGSWLR